MIFPTYIWTYDLTLWNLPPREDTFLLRMLAIGVGYVDTLSHLHSPITISVVGVEVKDVETYVRMLDRQATFQAHDGRQHNNLMLRMTMAQVIVPQAIYFPGEVFIMSELRDFIKMILIPALLFPLLRTSSPLSPHLPLVLTHALNL